jgi:hypothetical protein
MSVSAFVAWVLNLALADGLDMSGFPDVPEQLDGKLDLRLSEEMLHRLRLVCKELRLSISVYIRAILYAGYTRRLRLNETGGRYKLAVNDQKN